MSHLPVAGLSKPDKPAYCCIPLYAWLRASKPDVPFATPGDMLVAAILFCKPVKPLNELLDVDNDPDKDAETKIHLHTVILEYIHKVNMYMYIQMYYNLRNMNIKQQA